MIIRTPIKDALRASIEDEDAALRKRKPSREKMRRSSVKATARSIQRLSASSRKRGPEAGKPLEVVIAASEDAALKQVRDALRRAGRRLTKRDLLRVAIGLLDTVDHDTLGARLDALPEIVAPNK